MAAHHERRVALGDQPHGNNFLVRRWLDDGTPEVVAIDHDHSTAPAWPMQLWEDHKQHVAWLSELVRLCCRRQETSRDMNLSDINKFTEKVLKYWRSKLHLLDEV